MTSPPLVFVVGTGRCGSTALSEILRRHPSVLSLSELFAALYPGGLPEEPLDGAEFWRMLAEPPHFGNRLIRDGTPLPEHLYPHMPGRFTASDGIPALSLTTLPHLSPDPDALFDALRPALTGRPRGPVAGHYRALFAALAARCGGRLVVERSGYSLNRVSLLHRHFPEAHFLHLYRDGPDCAVSMSRHPGFRFVRLMADLAGELGPEKAAAQVGRLLSDESRPLTEALSGRVPVERFGTLWSEAITEGLAQLDALPTGTHTALAYEDLLDAPAGELTRLAGLWGIEADPAWLAEATRLLTTDRRGTAAALPPDRRTALREACAPGTRALAAHAARA
ncbi:sulfotransferase [Streptomyces sp. NBC_00670]|jgi:hypothetical protein|uniref:sulfotransferase n=1 Tax=Streptomyces sp. NBC_00670 TaxID=2975804 RepID=UPI002E32E013|nr:sulfotransferase [Streptomyces sp. NBC_00670]